MEAGAIPPMPKMEPMPAAPPRMMHLETNTAAIDPMDASAEKQGMRMPNDIGDPSPVIHCRNVTNDVTQSNLVSLFQSYGKVLNVVMLREKNQALIELESIEIARLCVETICLRGPGHAEVDGRRVWVKYSRHVSLSETPAGKTLLVSMFNPSYDIGNGIVTPLIIYQIFGNYGPVEKIVILPRNASSERNHNRLQALVQLDSQPSAERVKSLLQGQPVNLGDQASFYMDIQYSKIPEIAAHDNTANSLVVPPGFTPQLLSQPAAPPPQQPYQQPPRMPPLPQMPPLSQMPLQGAYGGYGAAPLPMAAPMAVAPVAAAPPMPHTGFYA